MLLSVRSRLQAESLGPAPVLEPLELEPLEPLEPEPLEPEPLEPELGQVFSEVLGLVLVLWGLVLVA